MSIAMRVLEKIVCHVFWGAPLFFCFMGCEGGASAEMGDIRCGKVSFSRSMAHHLVEARVALSMYQLPKRGAKQSEDIRRVVSSNVISKLKQDYVVTNYLDQVGICISADSVEKRLSQVFKSKKRADSFLASQTPQNRFYIRDLVRADLAFDTMRSQIVSKANIVISDEKVREIVGRIERYNVTALATNALIYAQASNCWREIVSGKLSFLAASLKYDNTSLDRSEKRFYWGEFPLSALVEDAALCRLLPNMKPGDISPPIEADNGLCVIQLIDIAQNEKKGANLSPEAYYRLNKIFFELPIIYEDPDPEKVRTELKEKEEARFFSDFMKSQYRRFGF